MTEKSENNASDGWVNFRPEIKVHDCSVRDGGLLNDHYFEDGFVKAVYRACIDSGTDYMELGYKADQKIFSPSESGPWKFCKEDDVRRIVGENDTSLKLTVMADAEKTNYKEDIVAREHSSIDCIRIATYVHQMPLALDMIKDAHDKGYETTVNLMAISTVQDRELTDALDMLVKSPVDVLYIVDSFGALYPEQVRYLVQTYRRAVEGTGKEVGIHAHNNQELAYANTIEALIAGCTRIDATIGGMGRGAGNCRLELILGFLKNPKFHLRPLLQCIQEQVLPLQEKMEWGALIPYVITGLLNQHPRSAIKVLGSEARDDFVAFYDQMNEA